MHLSDWSAACAQQLNTALQFLTVSSHEPCIAVSCMLVTQQHLSGYDRKCQADCCCPAGSTNDAYAPAWFAPQDTPAAAADDLERAVLASVEGSDILQQVTLASGAEYRAFSAPRCVDSDKGCQQQL